MTDWFSLLYSGQFMATYLVRAQTGSAKTIVTLMLLRHNVYSRPC